MVGLICLSEKVLKTLLPFEVSAVAQEKVPRKFGYDER
jgi:hypothetical protein